MDPKLKSALDLDLIGDKEMKNTFNYVVDYIMAKRVGRNGKTEYLVKWENWPERASTWETVDMFASPRISEIFELGLNEQMGVQDIQPPIDLKSYPSTSHREKPSVKPRKSRLFATNFFEDLRKKQTKRGRKQGSNVKKLEEHQLFDVEENSLKAIKTYEKLIGASKRKSRMSCPSTPTYKSPNALNRKEMQKALSQRSERYRMREQLKTNPFNESCLSIESNESLEENKNPETSGQKTHTFAKPNKIETPNKSRKIKVNNDFNKMVNKLSQNCLSSAIAAESSPQSQAISKESPTKLFLNKVRQRMVATPGHYEKFLNFIIEFKKSRLELSGMLAENEELIQELFDILMINREIVFDRQKGDKSYPMRTETQINEEIDKWRQKLDNCLEVEERQKFWLFLENKKFESIAKASPHYLWLRIKDLLQSHQDLTEEFEKFLPNLCSNFYSLKN